MTTHLHDLTPYETVDRPPLSTVMTMGLHVNADTEVTCEKHVRSDGEEYFEAHFGNPGEPVGGLTLYMSEDEMLRLWFVFESARRAKVGA